MKSLITRTISGVVFLGVMLAALLWSQISYAVIFSLIILIMMHEYLNITVGNSRHIARYLSIFTGVLLFLLVFLFSTELISIRPFFILPVLISLIFIILLYEKKLGDYKLYPYLLGSILYIALPFSLTPIVTFDIQGGFSGNVLLSLFIILWCSDVGAYLFGMTFGQKNGHKLFPSISPKKSWEGYIGSVITSLIAGYLLNYYSMLPFGVVHSLVIAAIINIFGTLGDLVESQLKRNFEVKDAGKIMPGHGGLLDRFDGALLSFPVAIAYIMIFELL